MSYSRAQIDELKVNYAKGVKSIGQGDERVEIRSMDEMKQLIADLERSASAVPARRTHYPTFTRGMR